MMGIKTVRPGDQDGGAALTTVRDIMSTELVTVDPSANVTEAARAMSAGRSGSVLVLQEGSLVGIFTERDILRALAHSPKADVARFSSVAQMDGPRSGDDRPRRHRGRGTESDALRRVPASPGDGWRCRGGDRLDARPRQEHGQGVSPTGLFRPQREALGEPDGNRTLAGSGLLPSRC